MAPILGTLHPRFGAEAAREACRPREPRSACRLACRPPSHPRGRVDLPPGAAGVIGGRSTSPSYPETPDSDGGSWLWGLRGGLTVAGRLPVGSCAGCANPRADRCAATYPNCVWATPGHASRRSSGGLRPRRWKPAPAPMVPGACLYWADGPSMPEVWSRPEKSGQRNHVVRIRTAGQREIELEHTGT